MLSGRDVATARASYPDGAIVALVESSNPGAAIQAGLDGADIVIPTNGDLSAAIVSRAVDAARAVAQRRRCATTNNRQATHQLGTAYLSVGIVAELLDHAGVDALPEQLRTLAREGRSLTWQASRPARTLASAQCEFDVTTALVGCVHNVDQNPSSREPFRVTAHGQQSTVLANRVEFASAIEHILENSRLAGATTIDIDVIGTAAEVVISIEDNGTGIPTEWPEALPLQPFESGWGQPRDGLGLTVAAEFAENSGGSLRLLRRSGQSGTRVELRLPAVTTSERSPSHRPRPAPQTVTPLEAQAAILAGIARRDPLEHSLDAVIRAMEEQLPGSICSILLFDPSTRSLSHGASPNLPPPYRDFIDGVEIGPYVGSCGTAAYSRQPIVAVDIAHDHRWVDYRAVAMQYGLRSCWSTPILDAERGEVLGTFAVYHPQPWLPTPSANDLVERFTYTAAIAIGTHNLFSRLVESESRFRSAFVGAGVGMALMSPEGVLLQMNSALSAMLGVEGPGHRLSDFLGPDDATVVHAEVRSALAAISSGGEGALRLSEVVIRPSQGDSCVWTAMSGSLVLSRDGAPMYFCIELFDLTERRRVAHARREQAMAEAASKAKTDLLALVSHELRTPLNAINGFAQLMQLGQLSAERQSESVQHILASGRHLLHLINDLLDLSGAETGQLELDLEVIRIADVVAETVEILDGLAVDQGVSLSVRDTADPWIYADAQRLRQILINIVGNALKFTPPGGRVLISLTAGRVSIADSGPGIHEDDLVDLFTPFRRLGSHTAEGSGLGLALSNQLVEAMNGHMGVDSKVGEGSTFWVSLPTADRLPNTSVASGVPTGTLLSVEDDPSCARLVESAFDIWPSLRIVSVDTVAGAWDVLTGGDTIDMVLLDVQLPDGSGWDLLRRLRQSPGGSDIPAIVMSAVTTAVPDDLQGTPFLPKPVSVNDLITTALNALRLTNGE